MPFVDLGFINGGNGSTSIVFVHDELELDFERPCDNEAPLEIFKRDHKAFQFTVLYASTGLPVDITSFSIIFTVKRREFDTVALITRKNINAGGDPLQIDMTDPTNGVFTVFLVPSNTESIQGNQKYPFDIQFIQTGVVTTMVKDLLYVKQDITV